MNPKDDKGYVQNSTNDCKKKARNVISPICLSTGKRQQMIGESKRTAKGYK